MSDKNKKTSVFGIYPSVRQAEHAVDALVHDGFTTADVSVLMADTQGSRDFAHEKHNGRLEPALLGWVNDPRKSPTSPRRRRDLVGG